jgi:hypothetical protein
MDMPADQYKLYAEFGITSEKAQVLEVDAGNVALGFLAMFVDKAHTRTNGNVSRRCGRREPKDLRLPFESH